MDDILKSAGWSKAGTFCKFYKKPIEEKDKKVKEENSICRYFELKPKMGSNTEWIVSKSKKKKKKTLRVQDSITLFVLQGQKLMKSF